MQLACPHCSRCLEFSDEPPIYCGYCGKRLQETQPRSTAEYGPEAATIAPSAPASFITEPAVKEIGGYRVLRALGTGGMGTVYEAEDKASGRHVALKLVNRRLAASESAVERFRQEGRIASMIAHPHCVFVLAADEEAGQPYIVMELMAGSTLQDLVKERGPLPLDEAVGKILDVIEGVREAHRLGLIHRDIKPSNCFIEPSGRVKIGDFGLAKSLAGSAHLTTTGSFMGTPLYASPEQVRGEKVDHQSDVYSVAATLYFLLTGRAPFESADSAATLARIVSDPAPSMRSLRPELSAGLDKVVLRGLERDRKRRWRDLEAFQTALYAFVPDKLTPVGLWKRLAAFYLDQIFVLLAVFVCALIVVLAIWAVRRPSGTPHPVFEPKAQRSRDTSVPSPIVVLMAFAYFGIAEGIFGYTVAKKLLRLRVVTANGVDPPGIIRGLLRSGVFTLLFEAGALGALLLPAEEMDEVNWSLGLLVAFLSVGLKLLILSTMRARNGYRGAHEFASGTRVVQLPGRSKPRRLVRRRSNQESSRLEGLPAAIGNYQIEGVLSRIGESVVYAAKDQNLGRTVWIWLRPASEPPLNMKRQGVDRTTRLRWLASGQRAESRWDAFLGPPAGCSLLLAAGDEKGFHWSETRTILEEIANELQQASKDDSLPLSLGLGHIWLQPHGPVLLLDMPVARAPSESQGGNESAEGRALSLLRDLAVFASGGPLGEESAHAELDRPLPLHAMALIKRLQSGPNRLNTLEEFATELKKESTLPAEISRFARARGAIVTGLIACLVVGGTGAIFETAGVELFSGYTADLLGMLVYAALSIGWLSLTNWTLACWSMRSVLVGPNGAPATRRQRISRLLLFCSIPLGLTAMASGLTAMAGWVEYPQLLGSHLLGIAWGLAMVLTAGAYFVLALRSPEQSVHDRIIGTYLVPR
jgi:hypothetical protein